MKRIVATLLFLVAVAAHADAQAQQATPAEYNGEFANPRRAAPATDRIIVKWRGADSSAARIDEAAAKVARKLAMTGLRIQQKRPMSDGAEVLQVDRHLAGAELDAVIEGLQADPSVVYAAPDLRRHAHALTSDPYCRSNGIC